MSEQKTGALIRSAQEQEINELARDSMPKLTMDSVEIVDAWVEDGCVYITIEGEKDPIWHDEVSESDRKEDSA